MAAAQTNEPDRLSGPQTRDTETVERFIAAPPSAIFALLADAERHQEIDGSGSLRGTKGDHPARLVLGSRFGMSLKIGVPYSMVNVVVEYEADRRIAWQTVGPTKLGKYFAGRIWRYELEPATNGTLVRETWDISKESPLTRRLVRKGNGVARRNMIATLERIAAIVAPN